MLRPEVLAPFGLLLGRSGRPSATFGCLIQQLLGHARLDTTQIYTEVSIVQLREVHARTHPHGRREEMGDKPEKS